MIVRTAVLSDMPALLTVYEAARGFMRRTGNMHQWEGGFPQREFLLRRMEQGCLYAVEQDGRLCGAFALVEGEDPTYAVIDGAWRCASPYATIHQLASDGTVGGVYAACLAFARARYDHLRVDTHRDNRVMRSLTEKYGFTYCGTIWLENGDPRMAYEWIRQ